jgi:CDP-diacylglycerol---glycerol-3-phosphate 3-phosphatidyltransferase
MSPLVRNIPNMLTTLRLLLIPIFVALMVDPSPFMIQCAIGIFVFAAITDMVDGFIARLLGTVSDFGKLLDPLADKILVMAALVMLVGQRADSSGEPWVPAPMVVLILAREVWVTGLRGLAANRGLVVPAGNAGKVKTVLQMVAVVLLLMHLTPFPFDPFHWQLYCGEVGFYMLLISIVFSLYGAMEYTYIVFLEDRSAKGVGEPPQS